MFNHSPRTSSPTNFTGFTSLILFMAALNGCGPSSPTPDSKTQGQPASSGPAWFEEVSNEIGITYKLQTEITDRYLMPESVAGGGALFDMDGDGDLDAYFVQSGSLLAGDTPQPTNRLFENLGDGTFKDITEGSGAEDPSYGMGVAVGDFDNDSDPDLYITNLGRNTLLRNDGGGVFSDITDSAGVGHEGWGTSTAFLDYDRDGDLDLFTCNYLNWSIQIEIQCYNTMGARDYCTPSNYDLASIDTLYRNNGDGTFTDVTTSSGIANAFGNGLGVVCADFNADGWIDIFVANDKTPDHLWVNQRDGTFSERALFSGCAVDQEGAAKAGMGVTVGDIDHDGDPDLMVCNLATESDSLFLNDNGFFSDGTIRAGLSTTSRKYTRFGMGWVDFDNDGHLDLYQANGRVAREERSFSENPYAEPNLLFRGLGGGKFKEISPPGGVTLPIFEQSRGVLFGDLDNDGGMDVVVLNINARTSVLHNVVENRGHWLMVRVLDEHGRDAYGAMISVTAGQRRITSEVRAAYSYLASNDPRVHIGLGEHGEDVTGVMVRWVDGTEEAYGNLSVDQIKVLKRGEGMGN